MNKICGGIRQYAGLLIVFASAATFAMAPVSAQEVWDLDDEEREAEDAESHIPFAPNLGGPAPDVELVTGADPAPDPAAAPGSTAGEAYRLEDRRAAGVIVPDTPEASGSVYDAPVNALLSATLVDAAGEAIGQIQDVVLLNDRREAGLIVAASDSSGNGVQPLFVPVDIVSVEGDRVVMNTGRTRDELSQVQTLGDEEFQLAPSTNRPLSAYINRQAVTAR